MNALRRFFNYQAGGILSRLGYTIKPSWKLHEGDLNPVELAAAGLFTMRPLTLALQIGAFDGVELDPLVGKILGTARTVVLVEPQPKAIALLKERYAQQAKIRIVEAAVAAADGTATLYSDSELSPKASLQSEHLERFSKVCRHQFTVKTVSPRTLVDLAGAAPDLLQIDTEGMDWQILRLFFDAGIKATIINFENLHLDQAARVESRARLRQEGYRYFEWGWDTLAVRSDALGI